MGRKRRTKNIVVEEVETTKGNKCLKGSKSQKFICNECMNGFDTEDEANNHIIRSHYGLARINDESKTPFTEAEKLKALINAQKVVKVLKCLNNGCDKRFKSGLGLKMHLDLCGKSETELTTVCEVCGKTLKKSSISYHMKTHSTVDKSDEEESEDQLNENTNQGNTSRKRASAIRAQKIIKKTTKQLKSNDDKESNSGSNYESNGESTDEDIGEEIEETSVETTHNRQNYDQKSTQISILWKEFIVSYKDCLRPLPKGQKWTTSIQRTAKVKCPQKDCDQEFGTVDGLKYHYKRCGIEFKFMWKCNVCGFEDRVNKGNKNIVIHLWNEHKDSLPELPQELVESIAGIQKSISNVNRGPRSDTIRLKTADTVIEFHQRFYKQKSFPALVSDIDSWILVPENQINDYIPNTNPSVHFCSTFVDNSWNQLNLFESQTIGKHINFFIGGPVWSTAWCPMPYDITNCDQFLAIASNMNSDTTHTINDTELECGLIQLWNIGKLGNKFDPTLKPRLALSIAHSYGMVWDMEWCPGGTAWDDITSYTQMEANLMPRLGLLALACGDGFIRVHSIPYPQSLHNSYENTVYYNEPIVILNPPGVGNSVNFENTICKCLSWIKSNGQHLIVGGYGSGVAAVWDLTTTSSLLIVEQTTKQTVFRPLNSWLAHGAAINRIKWVSNSSDQFLVTCSFDRSAKLWNLKDLVVPITVVYGRKGFFTAIDTHLQWNGMFLANDDCYSGFQNSVVFKDFGFYNHSNTLSYHKSCVWDISISEWMSSLVSVDAAGEAVIYTNYVPKADLKRRAFDRIPLYHISVLPLDTDPKSKFAIKTKTKAKKTENGNTFNLVIEPTEPPLRSYTEFSSKYGLVFNDYDSTHLKAIPDHEITRIRSTTHMQYQRLSDYPFVSINRVIWSPNLTSCAWILTASQSGICRLSCLSSINPSTL